MSQGNNLYPPIDPVETETIGWDFGPALNAGIFILSIASITCVVTIGVDGSAASRLLGSPAIIASKATGAALAAVSQQIGTMVPGCTYRLTCSVNTSDNQVLELYGHIACTSPV